MLFNPDFYILVLKRADFIGRYVIASNVAQEKELTKKLEENFDFDALNEERESMESAILETQERYDAIYQENEYRRLQADRSYWQKTSFNENRGQYDTLEEFNTARKEALAEIDLKIKEIDIARADGANELKKITSEQRDLKIKQMQLETRIKKAQKESEKVIQKNQQGLSSALFQDLEIIAPKLTEALNEYFYEGPVRKEISRAIDFFTNAEGLKDHYYEDRDADLIVTGSRTRLRIPEFSVDLRVATGPGGTGIKKHITGEVFTEIIKNDPGLKNRQLLADTLQFTQTNLFETFASDFSRDYNLSFRKNAIVFKSIDLAATGTEVVVILIKVLSFIRQYLYILPLLAFLILAMNFIGKHVKERFSFSLSMPFLTMAILSALVAVFGAYIYDFLYNGKHSYPIMTTVHGAIAAATQIIFGIPALFFLIISVLGKKLGKNAAAGAPKAQ